VATVNFSVPEAVKVAFDKAFRGRNKSAVIAALMQRAIGEQALARRRQRLFAALTAARSRRPPTSGAKIRRIRHGARP
jgi:hypothetical protein